MINAKINALSFEAYSILELIKTNNFKEISCEYHGSGDSGEIYDVTDENGHDIGSTTILSHGEIVGEYLLANLTKQPAHHLQIKPISLSDFVAYELENQLDNNGFGGWENNEGSSGTMKIKSDGSLTVYHNQNAEGSETYDPIEINMELFNPVNQLLVKHKKIANNLDFYIEDNTAYPNYEYSVNELKQDGTISNEEYENFIKNSNKFIDDINNLIENLNEDISSGRAEIIIDDNTAYLVVTRYFSEELDTVYIHDSYDLDKDENEPVEVNEEEVKNTKLTMINNVIYLKKGEENIAMKAFNHNNQWYNLNGFNYSLATNDEVIEYDKVQNEEFIYTVPKYFYSINHKSTYDELTDEQFIEIINKRDAETNTNLMFLAYALGEDDFKKILERAVTLGVNVDEENKLGNTAAMFACAAGKEDNFLALYELGANVNHVNYDGKCAADILKSEKVISAINSEKAIKSQTVDRTSRRSRNCI